MLRDVAQKKYILCVDDHIDTLDLLSFWLRLNGYEVLSASNCAEALRIAERHPFEVCIVDARLPDGTGIELCQQVRQRLPHASFILNTGDTRAAINAEAEALGMQIIPKPTDLELLQGVVRNLVETSI